LTRYIAICLFGGYFWLAIAGGMFLYHGALYAGPLYDAALHSVFVGFVIAMIFGHAPIIFPAILGAQIKFYPVFYAHLILLHLSLVTRIIGDLTNQMEIRKWGGLLNETAILLFLALTVFSIIKGRKE
jgi:succinate dehydrogenase hydrophobic anchor subunit